MKKLFVATALVFLFQACPVSAQGEGGLAVKAGLNVSTLGGDNFDYATKVGFHAGALLEVPFSDVLTIQPEALLSLQGSGYSFSGLGFAFDNDINLFYLNIPVVAKYNVWDNLYIEAGPQLGILLSSNIDEDTFNTTVTPDKNTLDLGVALGAGYRLNENFYFQLRFVPSFINVMKDFNSKNRVFQLSAAYFID